MGQPLEAMDTVASLMVTAALVTSLGAGVRVDRGGSVAGGAQLEYCITNCRYLCLFEQC